MTPKFVVILDPEKLKYEAFQYNEPGPLPPLVPPLEPEEPKDGEPPKPKEDPKPS